jgi:Flp pilus assembly protein TadG
MKRKKEWKRARWFAAHFMRDRSGIAATEFALIVPIMLVLFFGVVEVTNGISAYRDVSIMAHTISDLTSQSKSVQDSDLTNFFSASTGIAYPYVTSTSDPNLKQSIAELWVNSSMQARVQWSKNSDGSTPVTPGTVVNIPASLQVANTYEIFSSAISLIPVRACLNASFTIRRRRHRRRARKADAGTDIPHGGNFRQLLPVSEKLVVNLVRRLLIVDAAALSVTATSRFLFDAASWREPVSTSLENALRGA